MTEALNLTRTQLQAALVAIGTRDTAEGSTDALWKELHTRCQPRAWCYHNTPVLEFHKAYEHPIEYQAVVPTLAQRMLRVKLLAEELSEFAKAANVALVLEQDNEGDYQVTVLQDREDDSTVDLVECADALGDLRYVVDGGNIIFGFPGEEILLEIHASNMSKLGDDGKPITRADGKTLKGPNYRPPNIAYILQQRAQLQPPARRLDAIASDSCTEADTIAAGKTAGALYHIGAQNDALHIIQGERPAAAMNDYPRHDAARMPVATVLDEGLAHKLVERANVGFTAESMEFISATIEEFPPVPMVLHCPKCNHQHIDAPEDHDTSCSSMSGGQCDCGRWTNPPHRSHWCDHCGTIWRPADVATTGVAVITTRGKADNWPQLPDQAEIAPPPGGPADRAACIDLLGLVGYEVEQAAVDQWTDDQVRAAIAWAAATHVHASDNDDVAVPPRPVFLVGEPWTGPMQGEGVFATNPTPIKAQPREGATA